MFEAKVDYPLPSYPFTLNIVTKSFKILLYLICKFITHSRKSKKTIIFLVKRANKRNKGLRAPPLTSSTA